MASQDSTTVKPQPTLTGYTAWVFQRLQKAKGLGPGPTASWVIDRWIDENRLFLEENFSIRRGDYEPAEPAERSEGEG